MPLAIGWADSVRHELAAAFPYHEGHTVHSFRLREWDPKHRWIEAPLISISIVSHGQGKLVCRTLDDLARLPETSRFQVVLTNNVREPLPFAGPDLPYPLKIIQNTTPKGFGANHNAAFAHCERPFFCVMNPDVRLPQDPFPKLIASMGDPQAGLLAPLVRNPAGQTEDSARHFPTPFNLAAKCLGFNDGRVRLIGESPNKVDWVAGMFMLFRADAFRAMGGFDEGFFLYYEDVDICARLWKAGWKIMVHPAVSIIHDAQRASHKNPRYLMWHLSSMARYFAKHLGRLPKTPSNL